MPFTLAHPAAAVPLLRPLKRFGVLSALVIGSMTPDFPYFLPGEMTRHQAHSFAGLFYFCLPYGLLVYVLFHFVLKHPLIALMPDAIRDRLLHLCPSLWKLPAASLPAVFLSLLFGAATHVIWDSFTHPDGVMVQTIEALRTYLFSIQGAKFYVFNLLQHSSTLLGTLLLTWWSARWLLQAPATNQTLPVTPSWSLRLLVFATFASIGLTDLMEVMHMAVFGSVPLIRLRHWVGPAIVLAVTHVGVAMILYSLGWNVAALFRIRRLVRNPIA
jgi:hypothetical protein